MCDVYKERENHKKRMQVGGIYYKFGERERERKSNADFTKTYENPRQLLIYSETDDIIT